MFYGDSHRAEVMRYLCLFNFTISNAEESNLMIRKLYRGLLVGANYFINSGVCVCE